MAYKGRILTGHRPTGPRHIGHLAGTLETWAQLQDSYECFFLVADLHVLTTDYAHPERVRTLLETVAWAAAQPNADRITPFRPPSDGVACAWILPDQVAQACAAG